MRLASRGLGRLTLPFRLRDAEVSAADQAIVLEGTIREGKVNWPYRAELTEADVVRFLALARRPEVSAYLGRVLGWRVFAVLARAALRLVFGGRRRVRSGSLPAAPPAGASSEAGRK